MGLVGLTVVANEQEAEVVCGMLRANDVPCSYRQTDFGAGAADGFPRGGPIQIFVEEHDLRDARELLSAEPG